MTPENIKEKVLKEVEGIGDLRGEVFEEDWNKTIIDLTLAEVGKVIDEEIKISGSFLTGKFNEDKSVKWRIIGFKLLKQKLGIK